MLVLLPLLLPLSTYAIPMTYTVNQRNTECLYDKVEKGEHVTISVFVTAGSELRAHAILEGPVAPPDVDDARDLNDYIIKWTRGDSFVQDRRDRMQEQHLVDFEKGAAPDVFDDDDDDDDYDSEDYYEDYDDYEEEEEEADGRERKTKKKQRDPEKIKRRQDIARMKREKERQRRIERMRRIQEMKKKNERTEGEPIQMTRVARAAGWYRACVRATWYQVQVELELRKSSELGPPDPNTGHVKSYESRALEREEEKMDQEVVAPPEEDKDAVKEEDFTRTREHLKKLNRLLNDIKSKQMDERHRLSVHAATNEHSHSRMVLSSLMETVLYMVITGFQVFTIRRWFSGSPLLGR